MVLAVTADKAAGRIYNVGEKEALTEAEWVEAIGKAAGWIGKVVIVPRDRLPKHLRPDIDTDQHVVVDTSRMRKELGYKEVVSNGKAMRRTVDWERAHPPEKFDPTLFDYSAEDALLSKLD